MRFPFRTFCQTDSIRALTGRGFWGSNWRELATFLFVGHPPFNLFAVETPV